MSGKPRQVVPVGYETQPYDRHPAFHAWVDALIGVAALLAFLAWVLLAVVMER
jgi:hypothetical protein